MELRELEEIIAAAGGKTTALEYASALLTRIAALEQTGRYGALLNQLRAARQEGDFRGRVLEVNFGYQALQHDISLSYGIRQGMPGDIDFGWRIDEYVLCIEMKLLGQDQASKRSLNSDVNASGVMSVALNDLQDIGRLQRDFLQKATTRKFNPSISAGCINLVAVDVAELQLGMMDLADCLLAVGGNPLVSRHCHEACRREEVIGVFERPDVRSLTAAQRTWFTDILSVGPTLPHPRDYIHGALLLFRDASGTAALCYGLNAIAIWNPDLMAESAAETITSEIYRAFPLYRYGA